MVATETSLQRSVIRKLGGRDSLQDVANHGADAGYSGFTYYSDTVPFFKRHRAEIVELVKEMADSMGENPADMVYGFNCLTGRRSWVRKSTELRSGDDFTPSAVLRGVEREEENEIRESIGRCLYGARITEKDIMVANALAWFALEETARALCD